jgi:hypothetical protein
MLVYLNGTGHIILYSYDRVVESMHHRDSNFLFDDLLDLGL